ncbi:hypothetical protein DV735_g1465, partial [Chaetothyriales sp. CBS 134920]
MDDLSSLNWGAGPDGAKRSTSNGRPTFAPLQPTPPSTGRASPLNNGGQPTSKPPSKPPTPAPDSFSNLVSFSSSNAPGKLSLAEQQKRLAEQKLKQQRSQTKTLHDHYAGSDDVWNALGAGTSTPAIERQEHRTDDDSLFADFHPQPRKLKNKQQGQTQSSSVANDDDPFGLGKLNKQQGQTQSSTVANDNDDDVLGLLGQPVSKVHKALAELVDMGFPTHKARQALEATESGIDVQAAVGVLLNQAHADARKQQSQARDSSADSRSSAARPNARERAVPQVATADLGNQFLKTANSWWKQGSKKVQQAMQELASDSDSAQPRQPKWMSQGEGTSNMRSQHRGDEAETERPIPPPRMQAAPSYPREALSPQPAFLRQQPAKPLSGPSLPRTGLNRQANEEAAAKAYVSSARRRKPAVPAATQQAEPALPAASPRATAPVPQPVAARPAQPPRPIAKPTSMPVRPAPPPRDIPSVSAVSIKASHLQREKGNECFKRGDYASAHQAYSTSLNQLPATHPLVIVLLTNRALTALKIGEPKTAVADSDKALAIIGVSKGEKETIDFGIGEPAKPMRDYYGKALMRKAEALEQMEKWSEAAAIWQEAVEGGHGGATSMQGLSRLRAANAALDRADDEKFALTDAVDLRIKTWRDGKHDNLRALLGSLDTVLWPEAGWKKISMADLVLPGKVKVQYMKGIAKVHPDKIPTNATTEQRMISAGVFSALNEAWDKFKAENNL